MIFFLGIGGLVGWVLGYATRDNNWSSGRTTLVLLPFALAAFIGAFYVG